VGLWSGNFGNWRYPGPLSLLWDKRYRNRQVEEVSDGLTKTAAASLSRPVEVG